ncbi:hypothetical protein BFP97_09805 [Roseivirga sp. 4D4]|uniref:hypothetical protein n=1 Tax=Roseivirga sp. 4D4 TaxID=1889784 RepID=UPI000853E0B1|nr:hypothetical protein [Roseivirga sp. 4D4]OEK01791.1 hypothetical protein BFP97_09805 [Roseivirga sp. 4D4]
MKKINLFFLILLSVFLVNCETTEIQEDTRPLDSRGCTFDGDDCDDGPGGGSGGPGGGSGGGTSTTYKLYMKGENSLTVNQGTSTNGTSWTAQGSVGSVQTDVSPAAAYLNGRIFTFSAYTVGGDIEYSWSDDNGSSWNTNNTVTSSIGTSIGMSAVTYDSAVYVAVTRFTPGTFAREIRVYKSHTNTSTPNWTHHSTPLTASENTAGTRGYLAVHNNELYIFYVKHSTKRVFYKKFDSTIPGNISWEPPVEITGNINGSTILGKDHVAAYSHNGNLYAVYKTSTNNMLSVNALVSNPTGYYVSTAKTSAGPSLTSDGTHLVLAYKGDSDAHVFYARSTNGQTWTGNLWAVGETKKSPYIISY